MSTAAADLARPRASAAPAAREGLGLSLVAFFSLAAFAAVRYATLIAKPPAGRVVIVAACVTIGCGLLAATGRLRRGGAAVLVLRVVLVLATFALSMLALHIPARLLAPGQWRHLVSELSGGADRLGDWLWPYRGGNRWTQAAVLLPVPAVLLSAGAAWFWPSQSLLATRRTLAVGGLLAIFVTGTANAPASVPAFDGFVLMALLAATLLLPLTSTSETGRALCWLAACAAAALAVQAALRSEGPLIHYRDASAAAGASTSFQWDQLYGPDRWPHSNAPMLTVEEPRPALLRVTSLDRFDGLRFLRSADPPGSARFDMPSADARRWREQAIVELKGLRSPMLASAGGLPMRIQWLNDRERTPAREADGTEETPGLAATGAAYEVVSYDPRPSARVARRAPRTYPRAYLPYAQFELPGLGATALARRGLLAEQRARPAGAIVVGPSAPGANPASDPRTAATIEASPYGPMFALARRLAAGASSSYDVASRIERYLRNGYSYDRRVALTRYPLEAFLFDQRRGYCQQFSGAMTLMLRMDGIPSRIGVGFRPAARGRRSGTWDIRASDAHAWVEVFFSGIGWVAFDPTPPTATPAALQESTALSRSAVLGSSTALRGRRALPSQSLGRTTASSGGGSRWPLLTLFGSLTAALALAGSLCFALLRARSRRELGSEEAAVVELRRALARLGRAEPGLTLARLEQQFAREGHPTAAGYVRAISQRRFGGEPAHAGTPRGRSQLRRALAPSRGLRGRLKALAALPPAWLAAHRQ